MMNDDMLRNIEYLREKANVSYEEAAELLERFDGNVMRVLVELEHKGRVYSQAPVDDDQTRYQQREYYNTNRNEAKDKAASFINKAFQTRLVVERKREDGEKETVANLSAPFAAGAAIVAPWLTVATAGLAFVTGHNVKIKTEEKDSQDS